ncbi:hypothetical protein BJ742DRAFT_864954 [Cladochytrium replicatum]|nr:hypothetical protein BJ742DRAFT_864954 [Cladochytrium replicatum]
MSTPLLWIQLSGSDSNFLGVSNLSLEMATTTTNEWTCSKHNAAHHAVFVSYRQNDADSMVSELFFSMMEAELVKRYRDVSLPVFLDEHCLPFGGDWSDGFINGLQKSRVVVYLLSRDSINTMKTKLEKGERDNILVEIEEGLTLKSIADLAVTLIPVLIGDYAKANSNLLEKLSPFAEFDGSTLEHSKSGLKVSDTLASLFKFQGLHLDPKNVAAGVNLIIQELDRLDVPSSFSSWATPTENACSIPGTQFQLHSRPNPTICINRDDILSQIDTTLRGSAKPSIAVLKGVGGSGKTFLATKFGYQCVDRGCQVAWLKADSVETVKESYIAYAQWVLSDYTLSQRNDRTLSSVITMVNDTIIKSPNVTKLIILDNIEDYEHVQAIIQAHPTAQFLLTTRNDLFRHGSLVPFIKVDLPDNSPAEQFVIQSLPDLKGHATAIVQQCERLPLRLEITVRYLQLAYSKAKESATLSEAAVGTAIVINDTADKELYKLNTPITMDYSVLASKVVKEYSKAVENAARLCSKDSHPEIVASLNYLYSQNVKAYEMLQLCSYLDPDSVALDIVATFQKQKPMQFWKPIFSSSQQKVQQHLDQSVPLLQELGLVTQLQTVGTSIIVFIHSSVQAQLKASCSKDNSKPLLAKEFYTTKMSQDKHATMQYELGIQNFQEARLAQRNNCHYKKAAELGHMQSCFALYVMFEFGLGVPADKTLGNCLKIKGTLLKLENGDSRNFAPLNFGARGSIIQNLDMSWSDIGVNGAKLIAKYLTNNSTLQHLDLGANNIGKEGARALSIALERNSTLQHLDLLSNRMRDEGARALSTALERNSTLQHLYLGSNKIGDDGARALSTALEWNSTLQHLDLGGNSIGDEGAQALSTALWHNSTLQHLDLGANKVGDEGARALLTALGRNSTLQHLDLGGNNIGDQGAQALSAALECNSTLQRLYLIGNKIGNEGAQGLSIALERNSTLQHLNLSYNKIGDEGARALSTALERNSTLQYLNLFGNSIGDGGARSLFTALERNSTVQRLNLGSNKIGDDGARALSTALGRNSTLQQLDLSSNNIGDEGAHALSTALGSNEIGGDGAQATSTPLGRNSTLQHLDLSSNNIGDEGAHALSTALGSNEIGGDGAQATSTALGRNSTLQHLDLSYNNIGKEGALALSISLECNSTLQHLDLGGNNIGDQGARALSTALECNSTLQYLNLFGNSIGDEGARSLFTALERNSAVQHLNLGSNEIGDEGARALSTALEHNSTLQHLGLGGNKIGDERAQALSTALERNTTLQHLNLGRNNVGGAARQGFSHLWGTRPPKITLL